MPSRARASSGVPMSRAMASAWAWWSRAWRLGSGRQFAEAVQRFGLADPVADVAAQREGLLVAGGGGRVIAGQLLHQAELVEGAGLAAQVAEVAEQAEGLLLLAAAAG